MRSEGGLSFLVVISEHPRDATQPIKSVHSRQ